MPVEQQNFSVLPTFCAKDEYMTINKSMTLFRKRTLHQPSHLAPPALRKISTNLGHTGGRTSRTTDDIFVSYRRTYSTSIWFEPSYFSTSAGTNQIEVRPTLRTKSVEILCSAGAPDVLQVNVKFQTLLIIYF